MAEPQKAYSYRADPAVPAFDDSRALFVFDGVCVLCSGGASWLMRLDRKRRVNLTSAQGALGQALYRHYNMQLDDSYLLLDKGRAYSASAGYLHLCTILGGAWHVLRIAGLIPAPVRDWCYNQIARNRYRWFGKADYCALLNDEQQSRLIS